MSEFNFLRDFLHVPPECGSRTRFLFAPFMQADAVASLMQGPAYPTILVTRWLPDDLARGVSDPEVYAAAKENGWTLLIHPMLHAKVYSWDLEVAILGSANITERALGLIHPCNEEVLIGPLALPLIRRIQLQRIYREAAIVTDDVYEAACDLVKAMPPNDKRDLGVPRSLQDFRTSSLPLTESPSLLVYVLNHLKTGNGIDEADISRAIHDAVTLGLEKVMVSSVFLTIQDVRSRFLAHPFIREIDRLMNPCIHFGELKAWVQMNCADVPAPRRRDLTQPVQNLFRWFPEIAPDSYQVDVPRRWSQRLCKGSATD